MKFKLNEGNSRNLGCPTPLYKVEIGTWKSAGTINPWLSDIKRLSSRVCLHVTILCKNRNNDAVRWLLLMTSIIRVILKPYPMIHWSIVIQLVWFKSDYPNKVLQYFNMINKLQNVAINGIFKNFHQTNCFFSLKFSKFLLN